MLVSLCNSRSNVKSHEAFLLKPLRIALLTIGIISLTVAAGTFFAHAPISISIATGLFSLCSFSVFLISLCNLAKPRVVIDQDQEINWPSFSLENVGGIEHATNSCYAGSVYQLLAFSTDVFDQYILKAIQQNDSAKKKFLNFILSKIIIPLRNGQIIDQAIVAQSIELAILAGWDNHTQNFKAGNSGDSNHFLNFLLSLLGYPFTRYQEHAYISRGESLESYSDDSSLFNLKNLLYIFQLKYSSPGLDIKKTFQERKFEINIGMDYPSFFTLVNNGQPLTEVEKEFQSDGTHFFLQGVICYNKNISHYYIFFKLLESEQWFKFDDLTGTHQANFEEIKEEIRNMGRIFLLKTEKS